ncbi:MAG: hypothetical protein ACFB8W_06565 [Elainellaceae cyanobacterium]
MRHYNIIQDSGAIANSGVTSGRMARILVLVISAIACGSSSRATSGDHQVDVALAAIAPYEITNGFINPVLDGESGADEFSGGSEGAVAAAVHQAGNLALAQILTGTLPPPPAGLASGTSAADYVVAQRNVANLQILARLGGVDLDQIVAAPTLTDIQNTLIAAELDPIQAAQIARTVFRLRTIATTANLPAEQTTPAVASFMRILSGRPITAGDLQRAIATYEAAVNNASLEFLQQPPAEFQVIQSALLSILNAGIRAAQTDGSNAGPLIP